MIRCELLGSLQRSSGWRDLDLGAYGRERQQTVRRIGETHETTTRERDNRCGADLAERETDENIPGVGLASKL
jgi:hypothetical protein